MEPHHDAPHPLRMVHVSDAASIEGRCPARVAALRWVHSPFVTCSPLNAMRESPMPDHVDPASSVEEAAGNAGGAGNTDNVVSLPTDNPFSAMDRS